MERTSDPKSNDVYNDKFEEYTAEVSFIINANARSKTEARVNLLNKLQFPGHTVANLIVTIKDLPDDK
tara:strand:- start:27707 stop:27910 length:204 start_codon:yes stop_codon:yes gene_type:complete